MSNTLGYALRRSGDQSQAVEVEAIGARAWRLVGRHLATPGEPWSGDFARGLARASSRTAWIVPEDDVTCSQTPMPRMKKRELVRAVTGWVARQEGGVPDDWTVSWHTFSTSGAGARDGQQVAMAYAHRKDVEGQLAAAAGVGVKPGLMLPPSLVLDQFFRAAVPDSAALNVWNLVFLGGGHNVLSVANRDGLLLTRPLPGNLVGGDQDEYLDRLATEIDRSVFFARQSAGSLQVDGVYVCGDPELSERLVARLRETSNVSSQHWRVDEIVESDSGALSPDDQLLAMAAALATRGAQFNLAPASRRGPLGSLARRRLVVGGATAAAALVPLLIVGGLVTGRVQEHYLDEAHDRLAAATLRAEEAAAVYQRQRLLDAREERLDRRASDRHDLPGLLRRLADAAPRTVLFRDLQVVRRGESLILQLTGRSAAQTIAEAQRGFMAFQKAVGDIAALRTVGEPRQLQIGEVDDDGDIDQSVLFTLECRLTTPAAAEEG